MASVQGADLDAQPDRLRKVTQRLRSGYDYRGHIRGTTYAETDFGNSDAVDRDFADWYGIGGSASYVLERVHELVEQGMSYVFFCALPPGEKEEVATKILPSIRASQP
jgi:hypothetical protein